MYVIYELYNLYTELSGCSRITLKPLFWDEKLKYKLYMFYLKLPKQYYRDYTYVYNYISSIICILYKNVVFVQLISKK